MTATKPVHTIAMARPRVAPLAWSRSTNGSSAKATNRATPMDIRMPDRALTAEPSDSARSTPMVPTKAQANGLASPAITRSGPRPARPAEGATEGDTARSGGVWGSLGAGV